MLSLFACRACLLCDVFIFASSLAVSSLSSSCLGVRCFFVKPQYMRDDQCTVFSVGQGTLTLRDRVDEERRQKKEDGFPAESGGGFYAREVLQVSGRISGPFCFPQFFFFCNATESELLVGCQAMCSLPSYTSKGSSNSVTCSPKLRKMV